MLILMSFDMLEMYCLFGEHQQNVCDHRNDVEVRGETTSKAAVKRSEEVVDAANEALVVAKKLESEAGQATVKDKRGESEPEACGRQ